MDLSKQNLKKTRINYGIAFFLLLLIEVVIAIYVHDSFIRPYIGDMLVVVLLYTAFKIFKPYGVKLLPLYIFLFAIFIECLQFLNIVKILKLENNTFFRIVIGSVFDIKDILSYAIGFICIYIYESKSKKSKY